MKRVVVTGLGCISALGLNYKEFAPRVLRGDAGIGAMTLLDTADFQTKVAAEAKGYRESDWFDERQITQMDRFTQFGVLSAREAVRDAGLESKGDLARRTAVVHGTAVGGQTTRDQCHHRVHVEGAKRLHPFSIPKTMLSAAASNISMDLGITGPAFGLVSACASAGHAVAMGLMMLRSGFVDVAIAGGSEACITPVMIRAWEGLRVMAKDTCRPFSRHRGGLVIGEGAGTMVLETLEHAQARGATIHAELAGVGMSSDAGNLVQPCVKGAAQALTSALEDARMASEDVDYINAHGTATALNDPTETEAIKAVFGTHARRLPISSSKSMFGHLLGAAAALEAITTVTALKAQIAPPTLGYLEPDPACDLDCVPNEARPTKIRAALSNSFGFGGMNTVLAFRQFEG
jgi:nodulation protein E